MAIFDGEDLLPVALSLSQMRVSRLELYVDFFPARLWLFSAGLELDFAVDSPVCDRDLAEDLPGLRHDRGDVSDQDPLPALRVDHRLRSVVPLPRLLLDRR